jgi:glycosyltransferase involved in cell wall biosynthesis
VKSLQQARIAIVCDWLTNQGGAEKVIMGLHELFPSAPIYTSLYNPEKLRGFQNARIHTSFLQKYPLAKDKHQFFLGLMPRAFESFNLNNYDIVISSSHSCAKGLILKPSTLHVSYCHSPMRYAWDNYQKYISEYAVSGLIKRFASFYIHKIRLWDKITADRVDHFIANSEYIKNRIKKFYRRDSTVIYPFIEPEQFYSSVKENFYIAVGRLTSYKKFDLVVEAFNKNGLPLKVIGTGGMLKNLKSIAGPNIEMLGFTPDNVLRDLYSRAKALVFPQCEDFGIIPLEAMASGCPVIAYGKGGALETVIEGKTGVLFPEQTVDSLNAAIRDFERIEFDQQKIIQHAGQFGKEQFNKKFLETLEKSWQEYQLILSK